MYRNAYAFRTQRQPVKKAQVQYHISDAWAAVAYADRTNEGQYVNDRTYFQPGEVVKAHNKTLAFQALERPEIITEEDRAMGATLASHFAGLLFRTIKGPVTTENTLTAGPSFMDTIANVVAMKEVGRYEVACMACLPNTYRKDLEKEKRAEKMIELSAQSEYLGTEGSRQEIQVRVLETFYSQKYNSLIVTAVRGSDIVKFFTSKDVAEFPKNQDITVKGSVKRTGVNDRTGGKETWLTRVKVV
jgi:hypothetical protein